MKNLYLLGFLGLFMFITLSGTAQEPIPVKQHIADKPLLFSQFPEKIDLKKIELEDLLKTAISGEVNLTLSDNSSIKGVLTEKIRRANHVYSVNIKLVGFPGALFNLSFVMNELEITSMKGRIIHPQYGDVLVLKQENNQYFFQKQNQKYFMTE